MNQLWFLALKFLPNIFLSQEKWGSAREEIMSHHIMLHHICVWWTASYSVCIMKFNSLVFFQKNTRTDLSYIQVAREITDVVAGLWKTGLKMKELLKSRRRMLYVFTDTWTSWKFRNNLRAFTLLGFFPLNRYFSELLLKFLIIQTAHTSCLVFLFFLEKTNKELVFCETFHLESKVLIQNGKMEGQISMNTFSLHILLCDITINDII